MGKKTTESPPLCSKKSGPAVLTPPGRGAAALEGGCGVLGEAKDKRRR